MWHTIVAPTIYAAIKQTIKTLFPLDITAANVSL